MTPADIMKLTLGEPTLLPVWPGSDKIVLVCIEYNGSRDKTVVFTVLESVELLEKKLQEDSNIRRVFVQLLKSDLDRFFL